MSKTNTGKFYEKADHFLSFNGPSQQLALAVSYFSNRKEWFLGLLEVFEVYFGDKDRLIQLISDF